MTSSPAPDQPTVDRWHRWFAVELNNRGWDLASAPIELARAASVAGDGPFHAKQYESATTAVRAIRDDEDRRIMAKMLESVPTPV